MSAFIPTPDVLPVPAPVPVFEYLLHLTLTLHLIAMNGLLGGFVLAAASFVSRHEPGDPHDQVLERLIKLLPTMISATVTLGVAPLLFMQVLYGHFFYTSSILMGWPWFLVVILLIFAYYGSYLNSFKKERLGGARGPVLFLCLVLTAFVGWLFSNNTTLMLTPEAWPEMYFAAPGGTTLNTGEPMLWPRYLHMLLGAVAVAGLLLALLGKRKRESAGFADFVVRRGMGWFFWATLLNVLAGFWYLFALRGDVTKLFLGGGGHATGLLGVGVVLAAAILVLADRGRRDPGRSLAPVSIATFVTVLTMVLMRDLVRGAYLGEHFEVRTLEAAPQLMNMLIFVVLLVGGLAVLFWMLKKFFTAES